MAKTWVLETETKGTGAHVAPLERAGRGLRPEPALDIVSLRRPRRPATAGEPAQAPRFKVVDVMSAEVIAEGVDARAAVDVLRRMRSVHDARVYVRVKASSRWRLLTFAEQRSLWRLRAASPAAVTANAHA